MFTFNVDLGQVIIAVLIAIVGWLVKNKIDTFDRRLDKHENVIFTMSGNVQNIMGMLGSRNTDRIVKD